jgi:hypothetical protein
MSSIIDALTNTYPDPRFVYPTTREEALLLLQKLTTQISSMDEFSRFPEGVAGVVLFLLIADAAETSADVGDLGLTKQGYEMLLQHAVEVFRQRWGEGRALHR